MFEHDKKSPLERLKKDLYTRGGEGDDTTYRRSIHVVSQEVAPEWKPDAVVEQPVFQKPKMPLHKKILLTSFLFFLVAGLVATYAFFGGGNVVSVDNIDIQIEGPVSIIGGDTSHFNVAVLNKNGTDIHLVDLIVKMPDGTKDALDLSKDFVRYRESLDTIKAGGRVDRELSAVFFGTQEEKKQITFTVEYRTSGSNAIFYKEKTYDVIISSSPVVVKVNALKQINSGQQTEVKVSVTSNSTAVIKDLLLVLEYPFGFSFVSGTPLPVSSNSVFRVGDLAPGAEKVFTIKGVLDGQDSEERVLRAHVGIESKTSEREIATAIISTEHSFVLEKPFIGVDLALNGNVTGDYASPAGKQIRADINWTNNLPTRIAEAVIEVVLSGNMLDKNSVSVDRGFYNSLTNTITWDGKRDSSLALLAAGDTGRVGFSFSPLRVAPGSYPVNPEITIRVNVKGKRVDDSSSVQEISSTVTRSVKIDSELAVSSRTEHSSGPLVNSGTLPPRAEQKTTYTVIWTITNPSNSISNAQIRATLPPYVEWSNHTYPDSDITYNPIGGEVVWNIGDIPRGAGAVTSTKQMAFQVSITPSVTQIGSVPVLVSEGTFSGIDDFTGSTIRSSVRSVTTETEDLDAVSGHQIVAP